MKASGFVNYFGLQRFGTGAPTHEIGRCLLRHEWKQAIMLIMQPRNGEREPVGEIGDLLEKGRMGERVGLLVQQQCLRP